MLTLLLLCATAPGLRAAGTTSANFLKFGIGARNVAMGETGGADRTIEAVYWNPAGLAAVRRPTVGFMHALWFYDVTFDHAAYAHPVRRGTLALSADYLTMKAIEKYDSAGTKLGQTYQPDDRALTIAYAWHFGLLPAGLSVKYIASTIDDESASTVAGDIGVLLDPFLPPGVRAGLSVHHVGGGMKFVNESYPLPMTVRLGATWQVQRRLLLAADVTSTTDADPAGHAGVEYVLPVGNAIAIAPRAGYKTDTKGLNGLAGLTTGLGIALGGLSFDYALVSYGDLDNAHRVSLSWAFGQPAAPAKPAAPVPAQKPPLPTVEPPAPPAPAPAPTPMPAPVPAAPVIIPAPVNAAPPAAVAPQAAPVPVPVKQQPASRPAVRRTKAAAAPRTDNRRLDPADAPSESSDPSIFINAR